MHSAVLRADLVRSSEFNELSRDAQLAFLVSLTQADDYARIDAHPRFWVINVLPGSGLSIKEVEVVIEELKAGGFLQPYGVGGKGFFEIPYLMGMKFNFNYTLKAVFPNPVTGQVEKPIRFGDIPRSTPALRPSYNSGDGAKAPSGSGASKAPSSDPHYARSTPVVRDDDLNTELEEDGEAVPEGGRTEEFDRTRFRKLLDLNFDPDEIVRRSLEPERARRLMDEVLGEEGRSPNLQEVKGKARKKSADRPIVQAENGKAVVEMERDIAEAAG